MITILDAPRAGHYHHPAPCPVMAKPKKPLGMVAVTVISPAYEKLGTEAVRRMKEFSGLDVIVITADDADGFSPKLLIDQFIGPRPIVFFDSDWWLLRPFDFRPLGATGKFHAVHDRGVYHQETFCVNDSNIFGFPPAEYFNSGFYVCDLGNPAHRQIFEDARRFNEDCLEGRIAPVGDIGEQSFLNAAVQKSGLLDLLPLAMNYTDNFRLTGTIEHAPREIIGLHAACFPLPEKWDRLTSQAAVYGLPVQPLRITPAHGGAVVPLGPPVNFFFTPAADCGDAALCLNLDRRPDRWEYMQQQCGKLGIPIRRQSAVDGKGGPKLHAKATALASATCQSHLAMWRQCLASGKPLAIFEDDVIFCRKFRQRWNTEMWLPGDVDVLALGLGYAEYQPTDIPGISRANRGYGLFAYALFPSGAAKLIAAYEADPNYIADLYTSRMMEAGALNVYSPYPFWCVAQWAQSDTHEGVFESKPQEAYGAHFEDALELATDAPAWMIPVKR